MIEKRHEDIFALILSLPDNDLGHLYEAVAEMLQSRRQLPSLLPPPPFSPSVNAEDEFPVRLHSRR